MFARNETSAPFAMPALCFIFYITSMFWASFIEATTWIAIVSISRVYMLDQCRRLLSIPRDDVNVGQWRRHFNPHRTRERLGARRLRADRHFD